MSSLLLLTFGTLVSEDLACVAAGVLVAEGRLGFSEAAFACFLGIFAGDALLYGSGRMLGAGLLRSRFTQRFVSEYEVRRAAEWLNHKGPSVIFASRFTPGSRLPLYVGAGVVQSSLPRFLVYTALACALWTPLLVGLTVWLGGDVVRGALGSAVPIGAGVCVLLAVLRSLTWERRRCIAGFLLRRVRWEFWPIWAAYLPLLPWFVWLAVRHRSLTVFTAANPGMYSGGLADESKIRILEALEPSGAVARFALVPEGLSAASRLAVVETFMNQHGLNYPVVLKPDVGERGSGVVIIRDRCRAEQYFAEHTAETIVQEYVPGPEFGVFYCREPEQTAGRILSITAKIFPEVTGDGVSSLERLVLADGRAVCLASEYLAGRDRRYVPARGERVGLVELGSHCRGAIFLDATDLASAELEARIDEVSKCHPGFFLGRFDVRATSNEHLRRGQFTVLELNGVAAEPTHIYDPAVSLRAAYAALFNHWRLAFRIGEANTRAGAQRMDVRELLELGLRRIGIHVPLSNSRLLTTHSEP